MPINSKPAKAGMVSCSVVLTTLAAIAPTAAHGQSKPAVTVVNPATNPVNTRITNSVVPVEISNADPIPVALQDADAGEFTHVGQNPSRLVSLTLNRTAGSRIEPVNGDGTAFTVPGGFRFVLTDIQWTVTCSSGDLIRFTLVRHKVNDTSDIPIRGAAMCVGGAAFFERHYTTGEVFAQGQHFTADGFFGPSNTPAQGAFAQAHGYLVPSD